MFKFRSLLAPLLAVLLLTANYAQASDPRVDRITTRLQEALNLTEDQQESVKGILSTFFTDVDEIRASTEDPKTRRRAVGKSMREMSSQIEAVLDDNQRIKYQDIKAEIRDRIRERRSQRQNQE